MASRRKKKRVSKAKPKTPLEDEWVHLQTYLKPTKLHALGVITVWWNACETHLLVLFMKLAKLDPHVGWIIAHDLGDISLAERIREIAKSRYEDGLLPLEVLEAIRAILKVYDVCRQNRNSLTHFKMEVSGPGEGRLIRMKGPSMIRHPLPSDISEFRRVANEIQALAGALRQFWQTFEKRNKGIIEPLPKIPSLPALLWKPSL